jgi:hypothetical protein
MRDVRWFKVLLMVAMLPASGSALAGSDAQPRRGCDDRETPGLTRVFAGTLGSFKDVPTRQNLGLLSVGGMAAITSHSVDRGVTRTLSSSRPLDDTFSAGKIVGGTPFQLGVSLATYGLGRAFGSRCAARLGADLIRAQLLAEGLSIGLKHSINRTRPDGTARSFPSGHTTVSFASATVLQKHYGWRVGLPAYGVATYVAASRMQNNRHYLSDVVFGAALGIVAGRTVTIGREHKFAIAPLVSDGGAGVGLTWIGKR